MPTKILIGSSEVVSIYLRDIYNDSKNLQDFPLSVKLVDVIPIPKTKEKIVRKDIYQLYPNFLEMSCMSQFYYTWKKISFSIFIWVQKRT